MYRARYNPSGAEVAIKVFDLEANWMQYMDREEIEELLGASAARRARRRGLKEKNKRYKLEEVWREVTVTAALRHPNICKFSHCFVSAPGAAANQAADDQLQLSASPSPQVSAVSTAAQAGSPLSLSPPPSVSPQPAPAAASSSSSNGIAQFFVVMPLCEGSLKQMLQALYPSGIKDDALLATILHPLLSALAYLHNSANHKIHRDIKLDNILLDKQARIQLADWGITEDFWLGPPNADGTSVGEEEEEINPDEDDDDDDDEPAPQMAAQSSLPDRERSKSISLHHHSLSLSPTPTNRRRAAAAPKFVGTPLMMAPELLAAASLTSMLPQETLPAHLRQSSALSQQLSPKAGVDPVTASRMRAASAIGPGPLSPHSPGPAPASSLSSPRRGSANAAGSPDPATASSSLGMFPSKCSLSFKSVASVSPKSDLWSLAITALEMAFGAPPHASSPWAHGGDAFHLRKLILDSPAPTVASTAREYLENQVGAVGHHGVTKDALSPPLYGFSRGFHDWLAMALVKDPAQRASATQLLNHPWIKKYASTKTITLTPTPTLPVTPPIIAQKLLYERLVDPWQRLVRDRRVREEKERKELERLAKKSLSKSQMRAMQQAQEALMQGQQRSAPAQPAMPPGTPKQAGTAPSIPPIAEN